MMDDTPPPTPPSLTNSHPKRDPPHMHNIEISTSTTSTTSSVYPTPPSTAVPSSDEHDHSVVPPPAGLSSAQTHVTHPLTTSEILKHLLPFLIPVPIPIRWDLGNDAALRDMFVRLLGDPALFALHRSGDSGADASESFALDKAKGKGEERSRSIGAEKRSEAGGKVVEDEKDAAKSSQGRGEDGEGKSQRHDQAEPVEASISDEDVIMHDQPAVSVPCSSSSHLETTPKYTHGHSSMSKSWSSPRKRGYSKEKTTFSPVDWSKLEPKTKEESSRRGARVLSLSLSPNARLILTPPSVKGPGSPVAAKTSVGSKSPSTSLHATGSVSPAPPFLKSRSSSSLSFNGQSPSHVSRSYTLPPQAEGSIAALREVALGTVFPDGVVFGVNKNAGGSGKMDVDAAGDKSDSERMSSPERKSRSEAEASSEEEEGDDNVAHNANTAREGEVEEKVMEEPTDDESMPISIRVQDDGDNGVGTPLMPVRKSLADVGRTHSAVSSSSLSTLTSLAPSTGVSRAESPQNIVPNAISNASESESGITRKSSPLSSVPTSRSSVLPASTSASAPSPRNVIDSKNVKFGPPKKKSVSRLSISPTKSSLNQAASHTSPSRRLTPTVSTPTPARQTEALPQSQTPIVSSQSSQATVDEESIAQDLIMTASSRPVAMEQEDIDQFSSLARPSPSKKVAGVYAGDDISMGTSVGSRAVGVDSQSQIESFSEATPKRRRVIQDEVEVHNGIDDRAGSIPLHCSPPALKAKVNENKQTVSPAPQLARTSSPLFTSPQQPFQQLDADEFAPMEDVDDDLQSSSNVQSRPTEKSPSHSPSQPVVSLSDVSDMTTKIVQAKRELNSPVPIPLKNGEEPLASTSPRAKRAKLTQQSSSSQPANRHVDNKGKGKDVARKSAPEDDVISISSDSDVVVVNSSVKEKGKETKKGTPTATNPASSQQNRPRPVPLKRKPAKKLSVFDKPPPEVVDLTTPVKEAPKTKITEKGKAKIASPPPSPLAGPSSSVKRTRSSRILVDDEEEPRRTARRDVAEPEAGPDQAQEQEPEQKRKRRAAPVKAKPSTPTPIKKYTARLAAEAEDSDDADIISVKRKPTKKPGSSTGGVGITVKRDPDAEAVPLDAIGGSDKMGFMGKLAGKSKQSGAKTRVKKRKRTPKPQDSSDEDEEDDEEFSKPPLKRVKARNGSAVPATSSTAEKGKGKESGSKPLPIAETESVQAKEEEEADVGNRYTFRSPRKEPSLAGISGASVSTPKKKRSQPVVWPKVENPNFDLFVNCDLCKKWYHIGCVGVGPEDVRLRETETYHCPLCDSDVPKEESPVKKIPGQEDIFEPKYRCQRRNCLRPATKKHRGRKSQAEIEAIKQLEETFDVEAFVGRHKKVVGGQGVMYEYLVKWFNYDYAEATWETLAHMGLASPATLLEQFEQATTDEGIDLENSGNVVLLKAAAEAGWTEDRVFVKPTA